MSHDNANDEKKSPYSEATVVQRRPSATPAAEVPSAAPDVFDARTVVKPSAPKKTKPPEIRLPDSRPEPLAQARPDVQVQAAVLPATLPASFESPFSEVTNANGTANGGAEGGAVTLRAAEKKSKSERQKMREAIDRKTRTMMMGFAGVCAVVVLVFVFGRGASQKPQQTLATEVETRELASEIIAPPNGALTTRAISQLTDSVSTTDVLAKFDQASQRAQERALDGTRSGAGF